MLRCARTIDAPAIARIFAPYAESTGISLATQGPSATDWEKRISELLPQFPFLVAESEGRVSAYAYASPHRALAAYRWCCEVSIYVEQGAHRRGEASRLYAALLEILRLQGLHNAYAGITLPNPPSVGLHEKFGFRAFATFSKISWKLGQWRDVGWWELKLQPAQTAEPPEPRPFAAVQKEDSARLQSILGP